MDAYTVESARLEAARDDIDTLAEFDREERYREDNPEGFKLHESDVTCPACGDPMSAGWAERHVTCSFCHEER